MKARILAIAALATILAVPAIAATFKVDAVHSSVMFRVKHANTSFAYGRFNDISGSFTLDEANSGASAFDFSVKVDSIDTASAARDGHLKGTDFFNSKQFPTITFKSKKVSSTAKGIYDVDGDLTLHGVTKPIAIKIEHTGTSQMKGATIAGIETTFKIKRSDFGMKNMLNMLGDEVTITVSSEGGAK